MDAKKRSWLFQTRLENKKTKEPEEQKQVQMLAIFLMQEKGRKHQYSIDIDEEK